MLQPDCAWFRMSFLSLPPFNFARFFCLAHGLYIVKDVPPCLVSILQDPLVLHTAQEAPSADVTAEAVVAEMLLGCPQNASQELLLPSPPAVTSATDSNVSRHPQRVLGASCLRSVKKNNHGHSAKPRPVLYVDDISLNTNSSHGCTAAVVFVGSTAHNQFSPQLQSEHLPTNTLLFSGLIQSPHSQNVGAVNFLSNIVPPNSIPFQSLVRSLLQPIRGVAVAPDCLLQLPRNQRQHTATFTLPAMRRWLQRRGKS